jgi:hypothetical protein
MTRPSVTCNSARVPAVPNLLCLTAATPQQPRFHSVFRRASPQHGPPQDPPRSCNRDGPAAPSDRITSRRPLEENALVCWVEHPQPWDLEEQLLKTLSLPLNIDGNDLAICATCSAALIYR